MDLPDLDVDGILTFTPKSLLAAPFACYPVCPLPPKCQPWLSRDQGDRTRRSTP